MKSKKKKKTSRKKHEITAVSQLKSTVKRFNFKRLLKAALTTVLVFLIYQIGVFFQFKPIIHIYSWLAFVLVMAFFILNRGFGKMSAEPSEENIPDNIPNESKSAYINSEKIRLKYARGVLYLLTGVLITLLIDSIYLVCYQWFAL